MADANWVVLNIDEVKFFQHFIKQYHDHIKKGEVSQSHHCAVAVLLELEKRFDVRSVKDHGTAMSIKISSPSEF